MTIHIKIDPGYETTGLAVTQDSIILELAELHHRTNIQKKISRRRQYRRFRRHRKTRYRAPRFNNRRKPQGWRAPTVKSRIDSIIKTVDKLSEKYDAHHVNLEVADFNISALASNKHRLPNWAYQKGPLYNWENVKMYVRHRDNYTCQYCRRKNPDDLEVDHITPKSRGGTDRPDNLVAACHNCNEKKRNMTAEEFGYPEIQKSVKKSLRAATFVNIVVSGLKEELNKRYILRESYGYTTKLNREMFGLPKTHYFDAACVGDTPKKITAIPKFYTHYQCVPKSTRILTIGQGKRQKRHLPHQVFGFRVWGFGS